MRILHEKCDPKLGNDTSLPYTAYIVEYKDNEILCWDIVIANKKSNIFDHYWDLYKDNLIGFKQSEGKINPNLWSESVKQSKKKR